MTFDDLKAEILSRVKPLELCAAYQKALIATTYDELIDAASTMVEGVNTTFVEWVYLSGVVEESLFAEFPEATLNAHGIYINNATLTNPCGTCSDTATGLRFGVLGEDDLAGEDRGFDADGHAFSINDASSFGLGGFGAGTHTGSLTYLTGFDASGNVIEVDPTTIGSVTADNGVNKSTATNVQLGGPLLHDTYITGNGFGLEVDGNDYHSALKGVNSDVGAGLYGSSVGGYGVYGQGAIGVVGYSTSGEGGSFATQPSSTNSVVDIIRLQRYSSGTPANGMGGSIQMELSTSVTGRLSNQLISKWADATDATRRSQFIITGVNGGVTADLFTLSGTGALKLNKYGINTFAGTAAYNLGVDASGNIVEVAAGGGGGGGSTRFGVSGEDDSASEIRQFNAGSNLFQISNSDNALFELDGHEIRSTTGAGSNFARTFSYYDGFYWNAGAYANTISSHAYLYAFVNDGVDFGIEGTVSAGGVVRFMPDTGSLLFILQSLPAYANNAAALSGGLTAGTFYRNGDVLQIVH
jgi:hypothetical protein